MQEEDLYMQSISPLFRPAFGQPDERTMTRGDRNVKSVAQVKMENEKKQSSESLKQFLQADAEREERLKRMFQNAPTAAADGMLYSDTEEGVKVLREMCMKLIKTQCRAKLPERDIEKNINYFLDVFLDGLKEKLKIHAREVIKSAEQKGKVAPQRDSYFEKTHSFQEIIIRHISNVLQGKAVIGDKYMMRPIRTISEQDIKELEKQNAFD